MVKDEEPAGGDPELTRPNQGGGTALDAETVPPSNVEIASVEEGERPKATAVIPRSDLSMSERVDIPSSAEKRAKGVAVDDYKSGSDVDPKEERIFDEGFTQVEVRTDG